MRREAANLQSRTSNEVVLAISEQLKRGRPTSALNMYEEVFRPHIYHQLERGRGGGSGVMGLEQWKLPVDLTRQLLRAAKDMVRYTLAEEFYTLLANADAVTAQDVGTMLSVLAMTSQTQAGEILFTELMQRSPDSPNYIRPTVYLYMAMLKLYNNANQPSKARKIWEEMVHKAVASGTAFPAILSNFSSTIPEENASQSSSSHHSSYSSPAPFKLIAAAYAAAFSAGIVKPEEFSPILDAMISSSQSGDNPSALSAISFSAFMAAVPTSLVKSLEPRLTFARKLIPIIQISNYVAILSAYAHASMRRQTEEIEEEMLEARLAQSPYTVTTLLALYTRLHLIDHQKRFMSKIRAKKPDLHATTTIMNALTQQGLSGTALTFFREFQKDNVFVDIVAYNSAMNAAAVAMSPSHVLELMQEARDRGLSLNAGSFAMLQNAYAKVGDLDGFRDSMVKMKTELGSDPDAKSWTAYLRLLRRLNMPAFEIESGIHSMLACGYTPSSSTLVQLLQHLERKGEVKAILRIEELAKSGALGPEAKQTISQNRNEMPIGPLLKQVFAHSNANNNENENINHINSNSGDDGPL